MSRQFKLKIRSGFTSPKQPSFKEGAMQHFKPPTFLTLTQSNRTMQSLQSQRLASNDQCGYKIIDNQRTQRITNAFQLKDGDVENSQTKSINQNSQLIKEEMIDINQFKCKESQVLNEQNEKIVKQMKQQKQKKKQIKNENINIGTAILSKLLLASKSKSLKSGFKTIISYAKHIQSLKLIRLFKQHCAIIIQKHFRRYIKQRYYNQFKIFVQRIRPSINAFQQGWKLRSVMKTKPILRILSSIKQKTLQDKQKQVRILKRQMIFQIARLMKGSKWLNVKAQTKAHKHIIPSKSALLDRMFTKIQLKKESNQLIQFHKKQKDQFQETTKITIDNKNSWEDIPIKAKHIEENRFMSDEFNNSQTIKPKILDKPKKIVKRIQSKSQSKLPTKTKMDQQQPNIQVASKQKPIQNKSDQPSESELKQRQKPSKKQFKLEKSKQKSAKQSLLEKRTKYDPRKAAEESKAKALSATNSLKSFSNKQDDPVSHPLQKQQSNNLQIIKQIPKNNIPNKRNILPVETSLRSNRNSTCKLQSIKSPKAAKQISKHIGISQIENVFYGAYLNKMNCIQHKLLQTNRRYNKGSIPFMKLDSTFIAKFNPKYFHTLETQIINCYNK